MTVLTWIAVISSWSLLMVYVGVGAATVVQEAEVFTVTGVYVGE